MQTLITNLKHLFQNAPARVMLGLWLVSAVIVAAGGQGSWLLLITATNLFYLLLTWVSIRLAGQPPAETTPAGPAPAAGKAWRNWAQLAVILAVILVSGLNFFRPALRVPLWGDMVDGLGAVGEKLLPVELVGGPANAVANPVQYFVIPLILLLLLGARFRELGFAPGHAAWRVSALWAALPLAIWLVLLAIGQLAPAVLLRRLLGNSLQNGFFEEFLFRGALMTRLARRFSAAWTLVGQALIFGLWHLASNTRQMENNLLLGLAACFVSQAVFGLVAGILFQRTRNLLAPSVMHVAVNTLGQTFG